MAYLQNALPVLPDSVPPGFPGTERNAAGEWVTTRELLYAMIDAGRMVFRHYGDDDGDGRTDAFVVEMADPDRPQFIGGATVWRAGPPEAAWTFRRGITDTLARLAPGPGGYSVRYYPDLPPLTVPEVREVADRRFRMFNNVVQACRLGTALRRGT